MKLLSTLSLMLFLLVLHGCGSKGPLYLPQQDAGKPADNSQQTPRR